MRRLALLFLVSTGLAACVQYTEPKANCFNFLPGDPAVETCTFLPLGGAAKPDKTHE